MIAIRRTETRAGTTVDIVDSCVDMYFDMLVQVAQQYHFKDILDASLNNAETRKPDQH